MKRTKNRVLVKGILSQQHALIFALAMGCTGVYALTYFNNGLTGFLGLFNIMVYAFAYTPLKRISIINTWVGAIVGAIPPLMGYTAAANTIDYKSLILPIAVYLWQFPHFNSLSTYLNVDYKKAGYKMMAVEFPIFSRYVALTHTLLLFSINYFCYKLNMTSSEFQYLSLVANAVLTYYAYRFFISPNTKNSKTLFFTTLIHLPILLSLILYYKKSEET